MAKMRFRTQYQRNDIDTKRATFSCVSPDLTKKSLADSCEIQKIYERLSNGDNVPRVNVVYDENAVQYNDIISAHNLLTNAKDYFEGLPAQVKAEFGNNLFNFAKAVTNKDSKLYELGILKQPVQQQPVQQQPVQQQPVQQQPVQQQPVQQQPVQTETVT